MAGLCQIVCLRHFGHVRTSAAVVNGKCAIAIGFPVVMKIDSTEITHKTEVGGVQLGLADEDAVRHAYGDMMARVRRLAPRAPIQGVTLEPCCKRRKRASSWSGCRATVCSGRRYSLSTLHGST